nr:hypothetical protein [Acetobacter persici]
MGGAQPADHHSPLGGVYRAIFSIISLAVGLALAYGGLKLLMLGGSAYYLLAGLAYCALAVLVFLKHRATLLAAVAVFAATFVWALCDTSEIGYWLFCRVWLSRPFCSR